MSLPIKEKAYAKINLYLAVGNKRADGFHDIVTYMRAVSLSDELTISVTEAKHSEILLQVEGDPSISADASNLAHRAAAAFLEGAGRTAHVKIHLKKVIPSGAGLGGGSSDAAAVLRALNRHFGFPLTDKALSQIAERLGSDVPFFLTGTAALCLGRGESITPLSPKDTPFAVIVQGKEPSNTAAAYRLLDEWKEKHPTKAPATIDFHQFSYSDIYNDFQLPISCVCPSVSLHLQALKKAGAFAAAMSGSGSAVFGLFQTEGEAQKAQALLGEGSFVCRFL